MCDELLLDPVFAQMWDDFDVLRPVRRLEIEVDSKAAVAFVIAR